jgi:hypothetical protein
MMSLRSWVVAGILLSCAVPSTSKAFAISLGGAFFNNDVGNGFGLNLYPQFYIAYGITPELQIGADYAKSSPIPGDTVYTLYIPAMVGVRFDLSKVLPLGPVGPFVAAHVGYGGLANFISRTGGTPGSDQNSNNLAYNFYAGSCFWLGDAVGLGVEGGVDVINATNVDNKTGQISNNELVGSARVIMQLR